MPGESLGAGNFPVTGTAFLWHPRWLRGMRIMASDAWLDRVVRHGINLRESSWARRVVAVAQGTIAPLSWGWRFVIEGGFRMRGCRPVAHLTGYGLVACCVMLFDNL